MIDRLRKPLCSPLAMVALAAACSLSACGGRAPGDGAGPGGGAGPVSVAVVTAPVVEKPVAVEVEALGTARANEAVEITSKTANTVVAVRFEEGQLVRRGQLLVELDGAQARADLAAAQAALAESRSAYARSKDLFTQQALSQAQLETIEATLLANEARVAASSARLADTQVRAPFDGRVGLRRVSVGALVNPGTVITTLDDTSTMKVDFDVPEVFLAVLNPGLAVAARSAAYAGEQFDGEVESVDSRVDPVTRSIKVRARLPNPDGRLRPGMFLTVRVTREPLPGLVVPEQALVPERGKTYLFVLAGGKIARREVGIGRRTPGEVEITGGVAAGERVVIEGTQKVRDGSGAHELETAPPAERPVAQP
jgi:membrane fusion protein (multidrug efflux system)